MHIALDKSTGDVIKKAGGGIERVSEGRFVVQQVQSKLRTLLGEWPLDTTIGWVNFDDFVKDYDIYDIESRARDIIINTQGVFEVVYITHSNVGREFSLSFEAKTIYGVINLTIPWGLT